MKPSPKNMFPNLIAFLKRDRHLLIVIVLMLALAGFGFVFLQPKAFFGGLAGFDRLVYSEVPNEKVNISAFMKEKKSELEAKKKELVSLGIAEELIEKAPISYGYIVQLKERPLVEKFSEITRGKGCQPWEIKTKKVCELGRKDQFSLQGYIFGMKKEHLQAKSSISNLIKPGELKVINEFSGLFNGLVLDVSPSEAKEIKKLPEVKAVWPNYEVKATLMDSAPLVQADQVWDLGYTGQGMIIAIIDTGIDYTHPDLGGCLGSNCKVIGGYDVINNDSDPMDDSGHGTHCAGIAAGKGALKGIAPDAKLMAYKVLNATGEGSFATVIAGIERAVDPNQDGDYKDRADVISMSLGGLGDPDDPASQAIDEAVRLGTVAVIAAGNLGDWGYETISSPATAREAITVGAQCKPGQVGTHQSCSSNIASFSSRGPVLWSGGSMAKPDVTAPGVGICAAQWDNWLADRGCLDQKHIAISGTSMATPHVAGAAALIRQAHSDWTPEEIKYALREAVNPHDDPTADYFTQGFGMINILDSIQMEKPSAAKLNITHPLGYVFRGERVDIRGTAAGPNFAGYQLSYGKCAGEYCSPTSWTVITDSNTPVTNGILASWDTSALADGKYLLKLAATNHDSRTFSDIALVNVDKLIQKGWPKPIYDLLQFPPAVGDIDGDGQKEIVVASGNFFNTSIYAWRQDGTDVPGWPKTFDDTYGSAVALGDLDNDGDLEIVAGVHRYFEWAKIYVWNHDGTPFSNHWPQEFDTNHCFYDRSPVLADINKDGKLDIIFVMETKGGTTIYVWGADGAPITDSLWPQKFPSRLFVESVAVGDINGDGWLEVVGTNRQGNIHIWNFRGELLKNFSVIGGLNDAPITGDINGDGGDEIIVATDKQIYAFNNDGLVEGWPVWVGGSIPPRLVLGDLDNDNLPEVVAVGFGNEENQVGVWDGDGRMVNEATVPQIPGQTVGMLTSPVLGDIDGDKDIEIILGLITLENEKSYLLAYHSNLQIVSGYPIFLTKFLAQVNGHLAIEDLDRDGDVEVIVQLYSPFFRSEIHIKDFPAVYTPASVEWGQYQHDFRNTGMYEKITTLLFRAGWNLFSLPRIPHYTPTIKNLFGWPAKDYNPYVHWWDAEKRQYVLLRESDFLEPGKAYWIKFFSERNVGFPGKDPEPAHLPIVGKQWNYVGVRAGLAGKSLKEAVVWDGIYWVFVYDNEKRRYLGPLNSSSLLEPGRGYVIKPVGAGEGIWDPNPELLPAR